MKAFRTLAAALLIAGCTTPARRVRVAPAVAVPDAPPPLVPANNPAVGGVVLPLGATIAADVAAAPNLATLARAVAAAGLGDALAGPGPLTLFAPTDAAWGRLAPGTVEALMQPDNRAALVKLLRLHLVPGRLTTADLLRRVQAGGGAATLITVTGEPLTATLTGPVLTLTDSGGDKSYIETADVRAANGVVHVVNGVLVPKLD